MVSNDPTASGLAPVNTAPGGSLQTRNGPSIAGIVLALNEADNISRCLNSLCWCDELIVLDSGSGDNTVALAQSAGARVYTHSPEQPFRISDQRNWALDNCHLRSEWILFLDADEVVTPELADEIRLTLLENTTSHGFRLCNKYLFHGRWMRRSHRFPQWHDRLLRRGALRFEGGVWEHFNDSAHVDQLHEPYLHYGNSKGFEDWQERHRRYAAWEAVNAERYLRTHDISSFNTLRRTTIRAVAARLWPVRPALRFIYSYVIGLGFTEGLPGLQFAIRYSIYEYMIVENIVELRRRHNGEPL